MFYGEIRNKYPRIIIKYSSLTTPLTFFSVTHCEAGWVGNAFLPFCYRKFDGQDELSSYEAADKRCRSLGGQLAPVTTNLDNRMAAGTNDFFYSKCLSILQEPGGC